MLTNDVTRGNNIIAMNHEHLIKLTKIINDCFPFILFSVPKDVTKFT